MPSIDTIVRELSNGLSERARDDLRRLAATPEARAAAERIELENVEQREALAADLAAMPLRHDRALAPLIARLAQTEAAVRAAESTLAEKRHAHMLAAGAFAGAQVAAANAAAVVETKLRRSADERLRQLRDIATDIAETVRHRVAVAPIMESGRAIGHTSNQLEIASACAALRSVADETLALELQPLSRAVLADRLAELCVRATRVAMMFEVAGVEVGHDGSLRRTGMAVKGEPQ